MKVSCREYHGMEQERVLVKSSDLRRSSAVYQLCDGSKCLDLSVPPHL